MQARRVYVVIAGNICAGKTTVVKLICDGRSSLQRRRRNEGVFLAE
jgi:uridine kinase